MPGYPLEKNKFIEWRGYLLPSWLFYCSSGKAGFISPAAIFNPVSALRGQPWQTALSPSAIPKLKSLVLTVAIYKDIIARRSGRLLFRGGKREDSQFTSVTKEMMGLLG